MSSGLDWAFPWAHEFSLCLYGCWVGLYHHEFIGIVFIELNLLLTPSILDHTHTTHTYLLKVWEALCS